MPADFTVVQGDTLPAFEDTLTYKSGAAAEPESVTFVMRSLTSTTPLTLTGTSTVVTKSEGKVRFTPSAADTGTAGLFQAQWQAKISGKLMTFPTTGYLWVEVAPNLTSSTAQQIVGLPEVKDHLFINAADRTHDDTLVRMIEAVRPLIENLTGPILLETYSEWYEGGQVAIALRHKPSYGFGTEPVFRILACSEYRGPIEYVLSVVGSPTEGSVYSVMAHAELGTITRRTSGGGSTNFWHDPKHPEQSVHVVYQVGQASVPTNVQQAALETIRWWFETTMAVGRGSLTRADAEIPKPMVALPYHCVAMLEPTRRAPAIA